MKSKQQLTVIALKAVDKRLKNRLESLSPYQEWNLQSLIRKYEHAWEALNFGSDTETIIYEGIRPTTLESFCRYADRNCLTPEIILHHIRKVGTPLDAQAMYLTDQYKSDIEIQDLVEFIISHPCGTSHFQKAKALRNIAQDIKALIFFQPSKTLLNKVKSFFRVPEPEILDTP